MADDDTIELPTPLSRYAMGRHLPRVLKGLLTFESAPTIYGRQGRAEWIAQPQEVFRPRGLMLWNVPDGALVDFIIVGNVPQLTVTSGPIPARWFTTYDTYDQVWKAHQEGKEPAGWGDFNIISIGMLFRLRISRPEPLPTVEDWRRVQLLVWGDAIR